jgi:cellulose synthase operon protein C
MALKKSAFLLAALLAASLTLSACQSSEEKAESYYQSGLELLAKGDEDRALVEFRNVFKYNGFHKEARKTYADLMVKRGNVAEAYSQYLRLIEQYPDTPDVRMTLAELAMGQGNWDEVERHGHAAIALAPEDPRAQALRIALDYRTAALAKNTAQTAALADEAQKLVAVLPDNLVLRRVLIDYKLGSAEPQAAQADVDAAIALLPNSLEFQTQKLRLLSRVNDGAGVGAQLEKMVGLFPDNQLIQKSLIDWYMVSRNFDGAEAFLRKQAGDVTADPKKHLTVVQLLNTAKGPAAGRAELVSLAEANKGTPQADVYNSVLASMDFQDGKQDQAIATLQEIVTKAQESDQTRDIKIILARMLDATGKHDPAATLISQVLEADPANTEALKLRAMWAISQDRTGDAIQDLRNAQGQAPRDPQIMTLLAGAFERDGSPDLAGEQLSKAVEASGSAAEESLRYAAFLSKQGRGQIAESILTDARRVSPGNIAILSGLASIYLEGQQWPQVRDIISSLKQIATPDSQKLAQQLDAAILLGQNQVDDGLALLEKQAQGSGGDTQSAALVVLTQLRAGKVADARRFLDEALKKTPEDATLLLMSANVDALLGKTDEAEASYRSLMEKAPKWEMPVRMLYSLMTSLNRKDEAQKVLDAGLAAQPDNGTLLWIKAGNLERAGDIDGTIAIYEKLYEADTSNVVAANNLASMITTHRDDAASLDRAANIARRLRNSDVPAFQDTYGWIEFRRGNVDEALPYLEAAAKGLPNDALAQFHLGMAYAGLNRKDQALSQLDLAQKLDKGQNPAQMALAAAKVKELTAAP